MNVTLLKNLVLWARGQSDDLDAEFAELGIHDWQQDEWAVERRNGECKTSFCIAGAAVHLTHGIAGFLPDYWFDKDFCMVYDPKPGQHVFRRITGISGWNIKEMARNALAITDDEADSLFRGENKIEDIERIAGEIATKHGEVLFP